MARANPTSPASRTSARLSTWSAASTSKPERYKGMCPSYVKELHGQSLGPRHRPRVVTGTTNKQEFEGSLTKPPAVVEMERTKRKNGEDTVQYFRRQHVREHTVPDHDPPTSLNQPPPKLLDATDAAVKPYSELGTTVDVPLHRRLPESDEPYRKLPELGQMIHSGMAQSTVGSEKGVQRRAVLESSIGPDACDLHSLKNLTLTSRMASSFGSTLGPNLPSVPVAKTRLGATPYTLSAHLTQNASDSAGYAAPTDRFTDEGRGLRTYSVRVAEREAAGRLQQIKLSKKVDSEARVLKAYADELERKEKAAQARIAGRRRLQNQYYQQVSTRHTQAVPSSCSGAS